MEGRHLPAAPTSVVVKMQDVYRHLRNRYVKLAEGTDSEERVERMMDTVVHNSYRWPKDKLGRWIGYVQCILIEVEQVTTMDEECNHITGVCAEAYIEQGYSLPFDEDF